MVDAGPRPVDMFYWESFGKGWVTDARSSSCPTRRTTRPSGALPDLSRAD